MNTNTPANHAKPDAVILPPPRHNPMLTALAMALATGRGSINPLTRGDTTKEELTAALERLNPLEQERLAKEFYERRRQAHIAQLKANEEARRKPGILDRIQTCESREAAFLMFHEFLDTANSVSQKTINRANRLLQTLDFPQA